MISSGRYSYQNCGGLRLIDVTDCWEDRYTYTLNNPVKYNDPTGHMVDTDGSYNPWKRTVRTASGVRVPLVFSNVSFEGNFSQRETELVFEALTGNLAEYESVESFQEATGEVVFSRENTWGRSNFQRSTGVIRLFDDTFLPLERATGDVSEEWADNWARYAISHELGHDIGLYDRADDGPLWWLKIDGATVQGSVFRDQFWEGCESMSSGICYDTNAVSPGATDYGLTDSGEDFADTYAFLVSNNNGWYEPSPPPNSERLWLMDSLID